MHDKLKNRILAALFVLIVTGGFLLHVLLPDKTLSTAERRSLAKLPQVSLSSLLGGNFSQNFDTYALDQFPFRDAFRSVKAFVQYKLLGRKDNNGIFLTEGHIGKLEYPLSKSSARRAAEKFVQLRDTYFPESQVFLSLVPDKSYFLAEKNGYPSLDYERMFAIMQENTPGFTYIDVTDTLSASDYYTTDAHWRQECLADTVARLAEALGIEESLNGGYKAVSIEDFYGVYHGQAALSFKPDTLTYLTSPTTEDALVYNIETGKTETGVYDLSKLTDGKSMDMYDIFLSGAAAVLKITNTHAEGDAKGRELILFRDSFGSSIAPLLLDCYETVTLVDIRYIASEFLSQYVDFHGQDVLFLYSTSVINSSAMLK
ncbi:MAG: hypothetical protein E7330_02820 [Clostridiales bacterium]|nr:hypothetical protein [Clostridiales bacterium]